MIKAIFLDWGYTLASGFKNTDEEVNIILRPFGLTWGEFFPHWRNLYFLCSLGRIETDQAMFALLGRILNLPKNFPADKIRKVLVDAHIVEQETIEVVQQLKKKYLVGCELRNSKLSHF